MRFIKTIIVLALIAAVVTLFGMILWNWQPFGPDYSWNNIKKNFLSQKQSLEKKRSDYYKEVEEATDEFEKK